MMDVRTTYTNRGRRSMTHEGYMYRFERELKSSDISWRCTTKNCNARLRTDSSQNYILQSRGEHSHSQDDRKLERSQLRSQVKRKAAEDISQRPSKIIKTQLQDFNETCLHPNGLKSCSKAIYRVRRKSYPTFPKSIQEVHEALDRHNMMTTKEENFLQANNSELGYIIFTCTENLKCLSSVSEIFMDGTFKCAPRFFSALK